MPAPVISGLYSSASITWQGSPVGQASVGVCAIPNIYGVPVTLGAGPSIIGPNAADFTVLAGQLPVTLQPGQTALISVQFAPFALGARTATLSILVSIGLLAVVQLSGTAVNTAYAEGFPSDLNFPNTKVGLSTTFANMQIVNLFNAAVTVTAIGLTTGTDFFIVGAPITPFVLLQGASSAVFSIQFSPTVVGSRNDTLNVTVAGNIASSHLGGIGSVLQSAFNLTGATQGSLFAFPGGGLPLVMLSDPSDLNTEEVGTCSKLHDYQIPNLEKQTMRVRGHYEDLGPAVVTITARSRRIGQPDESVSTQVSIGTLAADGWIREFVGELEITGELIQISFSRGSGPWSASEPDAFVINPTLGSVYGKIIPGGFQGAIASIYNYDPGPDQFAECAIASYGPFGLSSGNHSIGPAARLSFDSSGKISTYALEIRYDKVLQLIWESGITPGQGFGAGSTRAPLAQNLNFGALVDDVLRIEVVGNQVTGKVNGVIQLGPVTDNRLVTGRAGLEGYPQDSTLAFATQVKNFQAGPLPPGIIRSPSFIGVGTVSYGVGGPVSILDYYPEFEPKGEVIGGT